MTIRNLPKIEAFSADQLPGVDWDSPVKAKEKWTPVKAASTDDRSLAITEEIGERYDGSGVTTGYVRGFLRRVGAGPVTVNINSTGGDFFTGLAIYNMLREHDGDVNTNVIGIAASAASLIAMASDQLRVAKAGFLMVHNAQSIALGNKHDMRAVADMLEQFDGAMASTYAERSGIELAEIESYMDAETFFNGEKAVEIGMADALMDSDEVESTDEEKPKAAIRRIDTELAKSGLTRRERRALLSEISGNTQDAVPDDGTQDATDHTTPGAGELLANLKSLKSVIGG